MWFKRLMRITHVSSLLVSFTALLHVAVLARATEWTAEATIEPPTSEQIDEELRLFYLDTPVYMNTPPTKRAVSQGASRETTDGPFMAEYSFAAMVAARSEVRDELTDQLHLHAENDRDVADFLPADELIGTDGVVVRNLQEMETLGYRTSSVSGEPWSSSYWATAKGHTSRRYASQLYLAAGPDWSGFYKFAMSPANTLRALFRGGDKTRIDNLAPAEKYDLLIGHLKDAPTGHLAEENWKRGIRLRKRDGKIAAWMGLCHGWAAAAYMLPRPERYVDLLAANGKTKLRFYPSDIKALASQLWAYSKPKVRFLGQRCRILNPTRDRNGRIQDDKCFDVNPGIWHMAVVNQMANAHRNFIFDTTYDREIWNQPATAFSYSYFNPQTGKSVADLRAATVRIDAYKRDKFKRYRSERATAVVGIAMKLRYLSETMPNQNLRNSAKSDAFDDVTYLYDLEIDSSGEIIGGEWYKNSHPDFLWTPSKGQRAQSAYEDLAASDWSGQGPIPADWQEAALLAAKDSLPLARIVEVLVNPSANASDPGTNSKPLSH